MAEAEHGAITDDEFHALRGQLHKARRQAATRCSPPLQLRTGTIVRDSEYLASAVLLDRCRHRLVRLGPRRRPARDHVGRHSRVNRPACSEPCPASLWSPSPSRWPATRQPCSPTPACIHKRAIDAMLCATALASPGSVTVLTSDPERSHHTLPQPNHRRRTLTTACRKNGIASGSGMPVLTEHRHVAGGFTDSCRISAANCRFPTIHPNVSGIRQNYPEVPAIGPSKEYLADH